MTMKKKIGTSAKKISALALVALLAACTTYPKPSYNYVAASPDDPEIEFQSEFGVNTYFMAKREKTASNQCRDFDRVAYLQRQDSYLRDKDDKSVWKISAPPEKEILISGSWAIRAESSSINSGALISTTYYPGSNCPSITKSIVPKAGEKYLVKLESAGARACKLSITSKNGKPVESRDAPRCEGSYRSR